MARNSGRDPLLPMDESKLIRPGRSVSIVLSIGLSGFLTVGRAIARPDLAGPDQSPDIAAHRSMVPQRHRSAPINSLVSNSHRSFSFTTSDAGGIGAVPTRRQRSGSGNSEATTRKDRDMRARSRTNH